MIENSIIWSDTPRRHMIRYGMTCHDVGYARHTAIIMMPLAPRTPNTPRTLQIYLILSCLDAAIIGYHMPHTETYRREEKGPERKRKATICPARLGPIGHSAQELDEQKQRLATAEAINRGRDLVRNDARLHWGDFQMDRTELSSWISKVTKTMACIPKSRF